MVKTKRGAEQAVAKPIVFQRADPEALAKFDPRTKECTMNCGPHRDDPRSEVERMFLCEDCVEAAPPKQYVYMPEEMPDALAESKEYTSGYFSRREYELIYRLLRGEHG